MKAAKGLENERGNFPTYHGRARAAKDIYAIWRVRGLHGMWYSQKSKLAFFGNLWNLKCRGNLDLVFGLMEMSFPSYH